jgi:hypothetical protein
MISFSRWTETCGWNILFIFSYHPVHPSSRPLHEPTSNLVGARQRGMNVQAQPVYSKCGIIGINKQTVKPATREGACMKFFKFLFYLVFGVFILIFSVLSHLIKAEK